MKLSKGNLIIDRWLIAKEYIQHGTFIFDLITVFPLYFIP